MAKRKELRSPLVFVNYRIDDVGHAATRVGAELARVFGEEHVFLDHETIPPGNPWPDDIAAAIEAADLVLALIGERWLFVHDAHGRRRIDKPDDVLRRELEIGLATGDNRVVTVLVDDAKNITAEALEGIDGLAKLPTVQPMPLRRLSWSKDFDDIVALLVDRGFTRLPEPAAADSALGDDDFATFRKCMLSAHGELQLAGFETKVRVKIELEDLYVPLRAIVDLGRRGEATLGSAGEAEEQLGSGDEISLTRAFEAAARRGQRSLAVLGDPGAGKTTQQRRMLLACMRETPAVLGLPPAAVPLFLPLRDLDPEDLEADFEALLARTLEVHKQLAPDLARRLLRDTPHRLYLFDGLDEVPAEIRERTSRWIADGVRNDPDAHCVVTCRYAGYDRAARDTLGPDFLELHLRPLDGPQVSTFVHNWYRIVETWFDPDGGEAKGKERARDLLDRLEDPAFRAQRVSSLTANPLLLTNVCLVHRDRGDYLPEGRERLYRECLNVLLERWRNAAHLKILLPADKAREALQPAALFLHDNNLARAEIEDLAPVLEESLRAVGWKEGARAFLEAVRDRSGLLTGWSHSQVGFLHLGFQEYLAAREIHRQVTEAAVAGREPPRWLEQLADQFGKSWWEEVTLLLLGLEGTSLFGPLFEKVIERDDLPRHEDLVNQCLQESVRTDPAPFVALLKQRAERGKAGELLEGRQLVAARVLEQIAPDELEPLEGLLAESGSREMREKFGTAEDAGRTSTLHERTGITLLEIPAGSFLMGSPNDEEGRFDREEPQHEVQLAPFCLAQTPVTNEQYARFLADTRHEVPSHWRNRAWNAPEQPVVGVSWNDAEAYCEWADLVLPSEAQWEYACRAGTSTRFWAGDADADLERVAWFANNSERRTRPVGQKPPNGWGLCDMHGNVFEWCQDTLQPSYRRARNDGGPWEELRSGFRVVRGASWREPATHCRSAYRGGGLPGARFDDVGFRPARFIT